MSKSNKLKIRVLLIALCVFSTTSAIAQNVTMATNIANVTREQNIQNSESAVFFGSWGRLRYVSNNERVRNTRELFSGNHEVSHLFHSGRSISRTGTFVGIAGACVALTAFAIDMFDFSQEPSEAFRNPVLWIGVGTYVVGMSLSIVGNSQQRRAVRMFNSSIEQRQSDISMNLGITRSGGVGLMLDF